MRSTWGTSMEPRCNEGPTDWQNTVESRFLEPSISRTSQYLEPNLVSLGFASLDLYNSPPISRTLGFSNLPISRRDRTKPRFLWICFTRPLYFTADFSNPRFSRTQYLSLQYLEPNLVSLGFASLNLYNSPPISRRVVQYTRIESSRLW